ncbi:unnamed protein product, partial [Staurois parvus]
MLLPGPESLMGPCMPLNLPWPLYDNRLLMLLPGPESSHGFPCDGRPIAAVSIDHTLPCATFRSPHTAGGFPFFCHRGAGRLRASHSCCCQAPNLPWAPIPPPHAA